MHRSLFALVLYRPLGFPTGKLLLSHCLLRNVEINIVMVRGQADLPGSQGSEKSNDPRLVEIGFMNKNYCPKTKIEFANHKSGIA
jgi:hypothetical protein